SEQDPLYKVNPNSIISFLYPTGHFKILALLYSPVLAKKYLEGGALSASDWIALSLLARIVSALMGALTVVIIANIACYLQSYLAGWGAGLFLASNYAFIYYSHTANVDVPYLFWFSLALYCFIRAATEVRFRYIFCGALCSVFSIATKDNAIFYC